MVIVCMFCRYVERLMHYIIRFLLLIPGFLLTCSNKMAHETDSTT